MLIRLPRWQPRRRCHGGGRAQYGRLGAAQRKALHHLMRPMARKPTVHPRWTMRLVALDKRTVVVTLSTAGTLRGPPLRRRLPRLLPLFVRLTTEA